MNTITTILVSLTIVLVCAGYSLAANDFQLDGTVTKIDSRMITVKDQKGKEITIEGTMTDVKVGDPVLLKGQLLKLSSRALTAADRDFAMNQCQVPRMDVDVIPQLGIEAQGFIQQWVDAKDCRKFTPFKNSRNYYRKLDVNKPLPLPPAGWNGRWLTEAEFKRYTEILLNAPW